MIGLLVATSSLVSLQSSQLKYAPFTGLQYSLDTVPLIKGSGIQYYEKGWTRGLYSSRWTPIEIIPLSNGQTLVRYTGDNGNVVGSQRFTPTDNGFKARYEFRWRGTKPVMIEANFAKLWSPAIEGGTLKIGSQEIPSLLNVLQAGTPSEQRWLGSPSQDISISAPSATILIKSSAPLKVMDGRNHSAEWATGDDLFWLGITEQEIQPQQTLIYDIEWIIQKNPVPFVQPLEINIPSLERPSFLKPNTTPQNLIPKPKSIQYTGGTVSVGDGFVFESSIPDSLETWFQDALVWKWKIERDSDSKTVFRVTGRTNSLLAHEGYKLNISSEGAMIDASSLLGFRHGISRLFSLIRTDGNRLILPKISIQDSPQVSFRGVHLFVGPEALSFHKKLIERVLIPLNYNKVVLQCERTAWESTPGIETSLTMPKEDLIQLVKLYKSFGFEVIPLVQSFGHAEWLFANGKNLDISINPQVPYTIDPRKKRSKELLTALWNEVIEATDPDIIHFGLDEFNNRGIPKDDHFETRLWETHVPWLMNLAQQKGKIPMLWGDILLAPGEAPDATHAGNKTSASQHRKAVSKGAYIADWHYIKKAKPEIFTSLNLFKSGGFKPIASSWFRPLNIYGHTHAAIKSGAGTLQTTWAGYKSEESALYRENEQFSAFVLASEYAWSGTQTLPQNLSYKPEDIFQSQYFSESQPIQPVDGLEIPLPKTPLQLFSINRQNSLNSPRSVNFITKGEISGIQLEISTLAKIQLGEKVGTVKVTDKNGMTHSKEILYGADCRSVRDKETTFRSRRRGDTSLFNLHLPKKSEVSKIEVEVSSSVAGLRLHRLVMIQ